MAREHAWSLPGAREGARRGVEVCELRVDEVGFVVPDSRGRCVQIPSASSASCEALLQQSAASSCRGRAQRARPGTSCSAAGRSCEAAAVLRGRDLAASPMPHAELPQSVGSSQRVAMGRSRARIRSCWQGRVAVCLCEGRCVDQRDGETTRYVCAVGHVGAWTAIRGVFQVVLARQSRRSARKRILDLSFHARGGVSASVRGQRIAENTLRSAMRRARRSRGRWSQSVDSRAMRPRLRFNLARGRRGIRAAVACIAILPFCGCGSATLVLPRSQFARRVNEEMPCRALGGSQSACASAACACARDLADSAAAAPVRPKPAILRASHASAACRPAEARLHEDLNKQNAIAALERRGSDGVARGQSSSAREALSMKVTSLSALRPAVSRRVDQ